LDPLKEGMPIGKKEEKKGERKFKRPFQKEFPEKLRMVKLIRIKHKVNLNGFISHICEITTYI